MALRCNVDGRVDPFEVKQHAASSGQLALAEPFREYAHYWLAGDELSGTRAMVQKFLTIFRAVNNSV